MVRVMMPSSASGGGKRLPGGDWVSAVSEARQRLVVLRALRVGRLNGVRGLTRYDQLVLGALQVTKLLSPLREMGTARMRGACAALLAEAELLVDRRLTL